MENNRKPVPPTAHIDEYVEYKRIVGDDDNGKLFTPEEFEAYKQQHKDRALNRLYVSWTNSKGMDCKLVGPETPCFCGHKYRQHETDVDVSKLKKPYKLRCRFGQCLCAAYHYVPKNGSRPIRCTCKHFTDEHSAKHPYPCTQKGKCNCNQFVGSYTCDCGEAVKLHSTIVETRDDRIARGHPVAPLPGEPGSQVVHGYQAMGGITGFSSLAPGYMRMDESGIGAPPPEVLNAPITDDDHPFLRQYRQELQGDETFRQPGESEMDYYYRKSKKKDPLYRRKINK
ncbi:hypothetical protein SNEBB_006474 [Seison nebaliae]|nr:hypothetical protein SNEBB_006474 [Seison nebaliae]